MQARGGIDQLHRDPQLFLRAAQAALEHMRGAQLAADLAHILVLALEGEGRGARHHAQRGNVRQPVRQLVGEAIRHRLFALRHAHVDQRQHDDGGQIHGSDVGLEQLARHVPGHEAQRDGGENAAEPQRQSLQRRAPVRGAPADQLAGFKRRGLVVGGQPRQ